ncbi:LOG family protein [Granulicoccus phenolivorans]|uniref:LOG family protein n=1 Tax=Granulicoccus phenolivorans TaxID=266854 RepID=UPI0003F76D8F|nr:LOG family protein [Granulicoccus phenolivorans]
MRQYLEIETLDEFDEHLRHTHSLNGWFVQSVDLTGRGAALRTKDVAGAAFLGCGLDPEVEQWLSAAGALVFPKLPALPFDPYRGQLYTADELYDRPHYAHTLDARVYAWSRRVGPHPAASPSLAMALHDHAISNALDELHLASDRLVGVMGGHAMARDSAGYAAAARMAQALTRAGRTVLTGGGPGAMEAANLGAWFGSPEHSSAETAAGLAEALDVLTRVPSFHHSIDDWARTAATVRRAWPAERAGHSVGIPTWFYGHEPPNQFATAIAKYFQNALREDTLLHRCRGGIVFLEGAAGTIQELFQATTGNYYAADDTLIAPLVLVGREYWTQTLPAWSLLSALAAGRPMAERLHLVDHPGEAVDLLTR